ncbi:MAG: adenosine-specific kinase, partial [Crocosphaera sp.]
MELKLISLEIRDGWNLILGQSHFIKTVEDLYE